MTEHQEPKIVSPEEKQYTVLPTETDPALSLSKAMVAAQKAKAMTKKIRKPK